MSKTGEEEEIPPPKFDEESNPDVVQEGSKSGAFTAPILENVMRKLEKLKAKNKKLRGKEKKNKVYSSSSKDGDSEKEVSKKGRKERKHDKSFYNSISFNYNTMQSFITYTSVHVMKNRISRPEGVNGSQLKFFTRT
jgi:hypothetical protein